MITLTGKINDVEQLDNVIKVSSIAAQEIYKILMNNHVRALRIGVIGGGCSGMKYVIQLENNPHITDLTFTDRIIVKKEVVNYTIVIDMKSFIYMKGIEIDWEIANLSPRLVFKNPNAVSSCSCSLSFDPKIKT